jgi:hypothetical protein
VTKQFLLDHVVLNAYPSGHHEQILIQELSTNLETFWEIVIPEEVEFIELRIINLPQKEYFPVGLYWSDCKLFEKKMKTKESSFKLHIEAYIEKI